MDREEPMGPGSGWFSAVARLVAIPCLWGKNLSSTKEGNRTTIDRKMGERRQEKRMADAKATAGGRRLCPAGAAKGKSRLVGERGAATRASNRPDRKQS